jgi:ABC-2 type transport system permease protein
MMASLRVLGLAWLMHVKMMSRSAFDGAMAVIWPLFYATVAFFMFRTGHGSSSLGPIGLAAAVMGIWTAVSVPASSALQRERWAGTLELLVVAPRHLGLTLLPITLAASTIGLYCVAGTLIWARVLFGIRITIIHPLFFALGLVATVLTIAALGFLMAVSFVGSRRAWAIGAALEYPIWLVCGFLVPVSLLPGWAHPFSWALGPTWGMRAIREAAYGGAPLGPLLLTLALAGAYLALGVWVLRVVLESARKRATLSLA